MVNHPNRGRKSAGYVICYYSIRQTGPATIMGFGRTLETAWSSFKPDRKRADYCVDPATAGLIELFEASGGDYASVQFTMSGGVLCTEEEGIPTYRFGEYVETLDGKKWHDVHSPVKCTSDAQAEHTARRICEHNGIERGLLIRRGDAEWFARAVL